MVRSNEAGVAIELAARDLGATANGTADPASRDTRAAAGSVPDALVVGFTDTARDYQPGLQRAVRRTPQIRSEQRDFDVALDATAAKRLAETLLRRAIAARTTGTLTLPWRYAGLRAGDIVRVGGEALAWRVRNWSLVGPVVELAVERLPAGSAAGERVADAGRVHDAGDIAPGPTVLHVLDLPPLPGALPTTPRLLLAAAGVSTGWRRAEIVASLDGGASYGPVATLDGPVTMGSATTVLAAGNCDRWDRRSSVEVTLLSDAMWLESASEAAVLAGANLALVGDEIVQFAQVVALGPRRFRLSTLLRGRRATEAAAVGHRAGERFVMLDGVGSIDVAPETVGATLLFKALGATDNAAGVPAVSVTVEGRALKPLSPVGLDVVRQPDGSLGIGWTRRSRGGFAWLDGIDAPLGEEGRKLPPVGCARRSHGSRRHGRRTRLDLPGGGARRRRWLVRCRAHRHGRPDQRRRRSRHGRPAKYRVHRSVILVEPEGRHMAETTERYSLPLLQSGQAQKEVTHNSAIAAVDALLHLAVESRTLGTPPAMPAAAAAWIVGDNPSGSWAGRASQIALCDSTGWSYVAPREGCVAFVKDVGVFAVFIDGAWLGDGWPVRALRIGGRLVLAGEPAALPAVSGGTVVDTQARAAIAAMANAMRAMGLAAAV